MKVKNSVVYVHRCNHCKKMSPVQKMLGFENMTVCQACYEDTLLSVTAIEYYLLKENMQPLQNLPVAEQLNTNIMTSSVE